MDEFLTKVKVLADILEKKRGCLEQILSISQNQEVILQSPPSDEHTEFFDSSNAAKQELIDKVLECDEVFERFFDGIKGRLDEKKDSCKELIIKMQSLISIILELDVAIRAQELKNSSLPGASAGKASEGVKMADTPARRQKAIENIKKHKKSGEL
jgi:hypothetical protein